MKWQKVFKKCRKSPSVRTLAFCKKIQLRKIPHALQKVSLIQLRIVQGTIYMIQPQGKIAAYGFLWSLVIQTFRGGLPTLSPYSISGPNIN